MISLTRVHCSLIACVLFSFLCGCVKDEISISFGYNLSALSGGKFTEAPTSDDGSISSGQQLLITLIGDSFTDEVSIGAAFIEGTHYTASHVPSGLTLRLIKRNNTTAALTFVGKAAIHTDASDVEDIILAWRSAALEGRSSLKGVATAVRNISIDFYDFPSFVYSGKFEESSVNDGTVSGKILVTLAEEKFLSSLRIDEVFLENIHYMSANVPAGLTMKVTKKGATTAEIIFTGKAIAHAQVNDVSNVGVTWKSAALEGNPSLSHIAGAIKTDISLDFKDATPAISYATYTISTGKLVVIGTHFPVFAKKSDAVTALYFDKIKLEGVVEKYITDILGGSVFGVLTRVADATSTSVEITVKFIGDGKKEIEKVFDQAGTHSTKGEAYTLTLEAGGFINHPAVSDDRNVVTVYD